MVLILRYLKIKGVNSLKNSINASKMTKIIMDAIVYFARRHKSSKFDDDDDDDDDGSGQVVVMAMLYPGH